MHRGALSDLTTFITVANSLSFRGAGEQLGVTPSALSHSMKQLEERLGTRLLNRTTRSVSLTDAGLACWSVCGPHSTRSPTPWKT